MHDLAVAKNFYHNRLGFALGRESENALILKRGENQIVAHKVDAMLPQQEGIYPRHFGLIFLEHDEFDAFQARIKEHHISFELHLKIRFNDTRIEHQSFFLKDPSNNLLEFKYYRFDSAIFGEKAVNEIGETTQK